MLNCLEHLELYLKHCIQTVEFSEFLAGLDMTCSMEYNSSMLYKYIETGLPSFWQENLGAAPTE